MCYVPLTKMVIVWLVKRLSLIDIFMLLIAIALIVGVLIPTVGSGVPRDPRESATKAQLVGYTTALHLFKGEYGYYPEFFNGVSECDLRVYPNSERFIQTISARDENGERIVLGGNSRAICFYSFTKSELKVSLNTGYRQVVGGFDNERIVICIDHDGDSIIEVPDGEGTKLIRTAVTAYSLDVNGELAVQLLE